MKSTTKKSGTRVEIHFEIPAEEFNNYFEKAVSNLSKDLKMDGFRPGKVPAEIIEKELEPEKILEEAANLAAREKYVEVIIKEKIEAIGRPEIEVLKLAKSNPFEFKASVSVLPEIKLPDYDFIKIREYAAHASHFGVHCPRRHQRIADLQWPDRGNVRVFLLQAVSQRVCAFVRFVFQQPGQRYRTVEHESHQTRCPSWARSRSWLCKA